MILFMQASEPVESWLETGANLLRAVAWILPVALIIFGILRKWTNFGMKTWLTNLLGVEEIKAKQEEISAGQGDTDTLGEAIQDKLAELHDQNTEQHAAVGEKISNLSEQISTHQVALDHHITTHDTRADRVEAQIDRVIDNMMRRPD